MNINLNILQNYFYQLMTNQRQDPLAYLLKILLWFASILYWLVISFIKFSYNQGLFKTFRLSRPVISVGNITVGGVGKTPFIIYLARYLKAQGLKPVVLIHGYMLKNSVATNDKNFSDEAEMIRKNLPDVPILVGPDRLNNAQNLSPHIEADVFLLDDGFQHRKIHRQLDIVVVDTTNPFGDGQLLPCGILREPLNSLTRAHFFVLTKTDWGQEELDMIIKQLNGIKKVPMAKAVHRPQHLFDLKIHEMVPLSFIKETTMAAFCSIGDPKTFEKTLISLGAMVKKTFFFLDHYSYQKKDIERIIHICQRHHLKILVTTEKDEVKLKDFVHLFPDNMYVLSLRIILDVVEGQEVLQARLRDICQGQERVEKV